MTDFSKTDLRRVLAELSTTWQPWYILDDALTLHIAERSERAMSSEGTCEAKHTVSAIQHDTVGVIDVNGVLTPKKHDGAAYEDIAALASRFAQDDSITGVVLRMDSPGGMAVGVGVASDALTALASRKPLIAHTDGLMCSAAYWLGANAHAVIGSQSSMTGSVGTIMQHYDLSGLLDKLGVKARSFTNKQADLKGIGAFGVPLTKAQEEHLQAMVDDLGAQFLAHVHARRPGVQESALRGQSLFSAQALSNGVIDAVGTFEEAVRLAGGK